MIKDHNYDYVHVLGDIHNIIAKFPWACIAMLITTANIPRLTPYNIYPLSLFQPSPFMEISLVIIP